MSDKESLMSKMTKLKAVSRLMLQTGGESRSTHTQYAGGHIIVPTSVGAVIWIFREPPVLVLSTYQPRLSENFEGLMGMWIYQYPHWSKTRVKELTLDCQFFATTFIHENQHFFEIFQKLRIGGSLASEAIKNLGTGGSLISKF